MKVGIFSGLRPRRCYTAVVMGALVGVMVTSLAGYPTTTSSATTKSGGSRSSVPRHLGSGQSETVNFCRTETAHISVPRNTTAPAPAAIYVHGGGWVGGDPMTGGYVISDIGPALVAQGFVVANVSYRLGGSAPWPAQIEDVKCAVRYLRTYSKQ